MNKLVFFVPAVLLIISIRIGISVYIMDASKKETFDQTKSKECSEKSINQTIHDYIFEGRKLMA
uniref:Uncharacterized protein n=1 Tax=viral metagenome TaxID=1070528 RepID=A0A6C0E475_9ZZZZ